MLDTELRKLEERGGPAAQPRVRELRREIRKREVRRRALRSPI